MALVRTLVLALCLGLPAATHAQPGVSAPDRVVAITVDDLPYAGGPQRVADATYVTTRMVAALARYGAPASAFVTGANVLVPGQVDVRMDLLRRWRDAGHRLENHSCRHRPYHASERTTYLDDVVCGTVVPELLMAERGDSVRYFRAPMNSTGSTAEARADLDRFLAERELILAPFTVEHEDYALNALYVDALARGDSTAARRVGTVYLAQLDTAFAYAERLAAETFGRAIPHIFLIHSNRLNADYLGAMLERLEARGYAFVSLDAALRDEAYRTPDAYTGPYGPSWLHRWRRALELPNRQRAEPGYPRWVYDAYQALTRP